MNLEDLQARCQEHGYKCDEHQLQQFDTYIRMLQEWNERINLTAITEREEIIEKHFYDSLLPMFERNITGSLCDVGSGAGFPSIPMKILDPELKITILEPLQKRCLFLTELVNTLGLQDVEILHDRAEEYAVRNRECFDVVTARGVANLRILGELCVPLVKVGGIFLAMKGAQGLQEHQDARKGLRILGAELEHDQLTTSANMTRHNLWYTKRRSTDQHYPRPYARIKKNPL